MQDSDVSALQHLFGRTMGDANAAAAVAILSGAIGGAEAGGGIQSAFVTIPHAQILTFNNTYIQILPAPGPGLINVYHNAYWRANAGFIGYTGLDVAGACVLGMFYGESNGDWENDAGMYVDATMFLQGNQYGNVAIAPPMCTWNTNKNRMLAPSSGGQFPVNSPLWVGLSNPLGNIAGGDPANFINVLLYYSIEQAP